MTPFNRHHPDEVGTTVVPPDRWQKLTLWLQVTLVGGRAGLEPGGIYSRACAPSFSLLL